MDLGQLPFFMLTPALLLLFALVMGFAASLDRSLTCARWAAMGFVLAIAGLLLDILRPDDLPWLHWVVAVLHGLVMLCVVYGFFGRWRRPVPVVNWLLFLVMITALLPLFAGAVGARGHFLVMQVSSALMLTPLLWTAARYRRRNAVEAMIFIAVALVLLGYVLLIGMSLWQPDGQFAPEMRQRSTVNIVFNVFMALVGILLGVVFIMALGVDYIERQRLTAQTDSLTGVGNRAALAERLRAIERGRQPLAAVIAIDLDHFKTINDRWGHAMGDEVLRRVGGQLRSLFADHAQLIRIGGEEFLMLIPPAGGAAASLLALSVREAIASIAFDDLAPGLAATASVGIAILMPGETVESAMRRADQAVYCAKASGRNRVIASSASDGLMTLRAVA